MSSLERINSRLLRLNSRLLKAKTALKEAQKLIAAESSPLVICPDKQNGECGVATRFCKHSRRHKRNEHCTDKTKGMVGCPVCVEAK